VASGQGGLFQKQAIFAFQSKAVVFCLERSGFSERRQWFFSWIAVFFEKVCGVFDFFCTFAVEDELRLDF